jgi:flagellar hook-associated protein 1 FlgK
MATSIFGIATSGLSAAQAGLTTTSHNIANVNTTGFSRQQTVQSTPVPAYAGSGFVGAGVSVATVRRVYSEFLEVQLRDTLAQSAAAEALRAQMKGIEDLLGDPSAGLAPALNGFFAGVNAVSANPADAASRQALIAGADAMVARFHSLDERLDALRGAINLQVDDAAAAINGHAARIAELNRTIMGAAAQGAQTQPPNDLLDRRDALLRGLNREIGATAVAQSDGTLNVFLSNGQALVVGGMAYALGTRRDPESPQDTIVGIENGATLLRIRAADVSGGRLAGLLEARDGDLAEARNALGRIAMTLAAQFNDQHRLGQDRNGALGSQFFALAAPSAVASSLNTGSAQISASIASYSALSTSSYRVAWDGTNWKVTRLSDGMVRSYTTLPQTVDGVTISLASGTPQSGDVFRVEPTAAGASGIGVLIRDVTRIAAAAPIRTESSAANTGSATVSAGTVNAPAPPDANLQQTVTLTFTGAGTFDVSGTGTGNPAGVAYTSGAAISYNGWTIAISGVPAAGDTFTVRANAGGVADNRNALLLAGLQTQRPLEGGSASYSDAYSLLASRVGSRGREAMASSEALARLADQASAAQQSVSGVNLDEEAANLLRYQQAYQAAGKALAIASALFNSLLELGGR